MCDEGSTWGLDWSNNLLLPIIHHTCISIKLGAEQVSVVMYIKREREERRCFNYSFSSLFCVLFLLTVVLCTASAYEMPDV